MITAFRNEYRWLSNFEPSPFVWKDVEWATVEHAYQAAKTRDKDQQEAIRLAVTPGEAKRLGRKVSIREDWEQIKNRVMRTFVREKFTQNPELKAKLIATGSAYIAEGNNWGDTYWGVDENGEGLNQLGLILMKVRWQFQEQETKGDKDGRN